MDRGMAAARTDIRAVDRAAGARSSRPAAAETLGRWRWLERRGHRGDGAASGTLWRRRDLEAGMTRLLTPPVAIDVTLDHGRAPIAISGAYSGTIDPIARWKVETTWWTRSVVREYWKALLNNDLLCELYRDVSLNQWFIER